MDTTAISIRITSIAQDKGGHENYIDLEYAVVTDTKRTKPFRWRVIAIHVKNFDESGNVPNIGRGKDGDKISRSNSRIITYLSAI
jgi:hypothetical protein